MAISQERIVKILAEFFMDEFSNDPVGVVDYLCQGDEDADEVLAEIQKLKEDK